METNMQTTFRLIVLGDRNNVGQTALTPDLAKLVKGKCETFSTPTVRAELEAA
jgi:hypothetical protein